VDKDGPVVSKVKENNAPRGRYRDAAGPAKGVFNGRLLGFSGTTASRSVLSGHFPALAKCLLSGEKRRLKKQKVPPNPIRIQSRLNKHPFFFFAAGIESMGKNTF